MFLNIDAGELEDEPEELYALAHVVNIACGGHAGDAESMRRVVSACAKHKTRISAHPSYPDREGFGRREVSMKAKDLAESIARQCESLARVGRVELVKLHGALYHAAARDADIARACIGACRDVLGDVTIVGPPDSKLSIVAHEQRLSFAREGFADRGRRADGSLIPRGEPGALVHGVEEALSNVRALADHVDTICVHGDTPNAVAIARSVRALLDRS